MTGVVVVSCGMTDLDPSPKTMSVDMVLGRGGGYMTTESQRPKTRTQQGGGGGV